MNYNDWLGAVPESIPNDAVWKMVVYKQALFLGELSWFDVTKLMQDRRRRRVADPLYRSTGSISVNIAEGYSRSSKKDQARYYEYALGSTRETRDWYYKARNTLEQEVSNHRLSICVQIIKQLLKIIPNTRNKKISEGEPNYSTRDIFTHIPLP